MNNEQNNIGSDLNAVLLSFLAGIIQLLLFVIGAAGNLIQTNNLFYNPRDLPFLVLVSLIISLCVVGTISFFGKNRSFLPTQPKFKLFIWFYNSFFDRNIQNANLSKETEKKILLIELLLLLLSSLLFIISTITHQSKLDILFINSINGEIYQTLSFVCLWVLTTVILFQWISDEIEKQKQYKMEHFIPNFIRTLQSYGYVHLKIQTNVVVGNYSHHLIRVDIENKDHYFLVQFDGKSIVKELSLDEYNGILNYSPSASPSASPSPSTEPNEDH